MHGGGACDLFHVSPFSFKLAPMPTVAAVIASCNLCHVWEQDPYVCIELLVRCAPVKGDRRYPFRDGEVVVVIRAQVTGVVLAALIDSVAANGFTAVDRSAMQRLNRIAVALHVDRV